MTEEHAIRRVADTGKVAHAWLPEDEMGAWWRPVCGVLGDQHITNLYDRPMVALCKRCQRCADAKYRNEDADKP